MPFRRLPPDVFFLRAIQPRGIRLLLVLLGLCAVLLNGGMMAAAAPPVLVSGPVAVMAGAGDMPCCDHAAGGKTASLKGGLMSCPQACGGWPVALLQLPAPAAQAQRLGPLPSRPPQGLTVSPGQRPPIARI